MILNLPRMITVLTLMGTACDSERDGASELYDVSGIVNMDGVPAANATVEIDGFFNWRTQTDLDGRFEILNVTPGQHNLVATSYLESGSFSEVSVDLNLTADAELDGLRLPAPIELSEPMPSADGGSLRLSWAQSTASDFREYKLYVHDSAGLDESTGELIYVATEREDTEFSHDSIDSGQTYYYRVFVMNDRGRLGGSNIVSITAPPAELIRDGGFEDPLTLDNWDHAGSGDAALVTDIVHDGAQSLYLSAELSAPCCTPSILRTTYAFRLLAGTTYEFSAWVKARGTLIDLIDPSIYLWREDELVGHLFLDHAGASGVPSPYPDVEWERLSQRFVVTETGMHTLQIEGTVTEVRIDSLSIRPTP